MARICEICGKHPITGHSVSHSDRKTKRRWLPNVQRVRVRVASGEVKRMRVCTSCLKSGKVTKAGA